MKTLIRPLLVLLLSWWSLVGPAHANTEGPAWDRFPKERVTNLAALQNGAKLFVNYCLNCHSAAYMRYNRLRDIGLTEDQIKGNLLFTGVKVGDVMKSAIDPKDAKEWFGGVPPDLTLITRSRADGAKGSGADYVYTYLRSYYRDPAKSTGWNNIAFPNVAMPNVLWQLQGEQKAVFEDEPDPHEQGKTEHVFKGFEQVSAGAMSPAEYNTNVADLVAFLQWMGEPAQATRWQLGVAVVLFFAVFSVIGWRLNAAFWKDVK
jgi:ubiquinol-cytochrome c reductase cytochrome c1 subunit